MYQCIQFSNWCLIFKYIYFIWIDENMSSYNSTFWRDANFFEFHLTCMSMKFSSHAQYFHKYLVTKIEVVITLRHHSLIFLWKRNFSAFIEYKWAAVKFTLFGTCMISYIFFFRVSFCIFDEIAVLDMNKEKMNCIFIFISNQ